MPMHPERGRRIGRWVLALMLLGLVGAGFSRELGFFVRPDPPLLLEIRKDIRNYDDLSRWPADKGRFENHGFVPAVSRSFVESGWAVPPQAEGALRYVLPDVAGAHSLLLRLVFFRRSPEATNRLLVFREGDDAPRLAFDNVYFADARLDLSEVLSGPGGRVVLAFEGRNPTQAPDVFLQYFEVRFFADPLPVLPAMPRMALAFLALGLCVLPLVSWRHALPLWGILTAGFALRYYALTQVCWLPLDWDTLGYYQLANKMSLFTDTGFFSAQFGVREPFFVLVVKSALALLGDSETHVRLVSFFASLLVIGLTYRLGMRLFGVPLALVGAAVMAVNLPLVRESARGMRLEVELVLLLVLAEVLFTPPVPERAGLTTAVRARWLRAALAGMIGGVLALTRVTYLVTLVPVLLLAFVWRRSWAAAGLSVLMLIALQVPNQVNTWRVHGELFPLSSEHGTYGANMEFAGQAGFPSVAEVWRSPKQGKPISYARYLFGMHSPWEVVVGTVRGLWKVIRRMEVVAFHREVARRIGINLAAADVLFQIIGTMGLIVAVGLPQLRWIPALFLVLVLPLTFLYDRGFLEPWRLTYQAFPWLLCGALLVLSMAAKRLSGWWCVSKPGV